MLIKIEGTCQFEGCTEPATLIACGRSGYNNEKRHPAPGCYCKQHAQQVADEGSPEYLHTCPNCECISGVN